MFPNISIRDIDMASPLLIPTLLNTLLSPWEHGPEVEANRLGFDLRIGTIISYRTNPATHPIVW